MTNNAKVIRFRTPYHAKPQRRWFILFLGISNIFMCVINGAWVWASASTGRYGLAVLSAGPFIVTFETFVYLWRRYYGK